MASDTAIGQVWTPPLRRGSQPQGQRADGIKMLLDRCFTSSQNVSILQRSRLVDWRVPGSSSTGKHARKHIEVRRQSDKNDFAHTKDKDDSSGNHHQKTPTSGQQLPTEICSPGASLTREFFHTSVTPCSLYILMDNKHSARSIAFNQDNLVIRRG
ncbi:unnamed protein product [Caenorhabditis brenneri]